MLDGCISFYRRVTFQQQHSSCNMNPNVTVSPRCFEDDHITDRKGLPAMDWVYFGFSLTVMMGICLGNGLIIATCIRIWHLLTLSSYLILQLALADFALGCSLLYNALTMVLRKLMLSHNMCALRHAMYLFPGATSVIGILVITCNRYVAIVQHPLTYQDNNPSPRYYITYTLIQWIPSAILGFLTPMVWHNPCPSECTFILILPASFLKYMFMPFFVVLAFPMTALYAHIIVTAKKHLRNIADSAGQPPEASGQPRENVHFKGQIRILKACLLIFATFYISWLPFLIILGIQLYSGQLDQDSPMTRARLLTMCLLSINSLANPLIYACKIPDLKSEVSKTWLIWRKLLCHAQI